MKKASSSHPALTSFSFSLLLAIFSLPASAAPTQGGSDRGGGNAVVCFKSSSSSADILNPANPLRGYILDKHLSDIKSVQSYDLLGMNRPAFEPLSGETTGPYLARLAARFKDFLPELSQFIIDVQAGIAEENTIEKASPLYRVYDENDSGPHNPEYCVISTMALQSDVGDETHLTIDSRLFNHPTHSELSKHALYLHEYVYRVFRKFLGDKDSRRTRALVQLLMERDLPLDRLQQKLNSVVPALVLPAPSYDHSGRQRYIYLHRSPIDLMFAQLTEANNMITAISESNAPQLPKLILPILEQARARLKTSPEIDRLAEIKNGLDYLADYLQKTQPVDLRLAGIDAMWGDLSIRLKNLSKSSFFKDPKIVSDLLAITNPIITHIEQSMKSIGQPILEQNASVAIDDLPLTEIQKQKLNDSLSHLPAKYFRCALVEIQSVVPEREICRKYFATDFQKLWNQIIRSLKIVVH